MNKSFSSNLSAVSVTNSKLYLPIFILWPFLAFVIGLANFSHKEARKVVYFYLIYFGLTFVINKDFYVDAAGYAMRLRENAALPFSDFFNIVGGLYSNETSVDIIEPFISFVVSRFTDDHRVLFAVYAAVFGYFYLRSIKLVYTRYLENPGWNVAIHLAFFSIILTITNINAFRMWTAAWIFFLGAYHVILYRDKRYILLSLAACLVHWSFLSANIILIIYYFAGNRNAIYMPLAAISFVAPQLLMSSFSRVSMILGGSLQNRYDTYADEDYVGAVQEYLAQGSWFMEMGNILVYYYLIVALVLIQLRSRRIVKKQEDRNLYSFLLLFLSFVNFGQSIPSFGGRFRIIFFLFGTVYVLMHFSKSQEKKFSLITALGIFPMLLYVVVAFRQASEYISAWIVAPGFGIPLLDPGLTIADILF